MKLELKHIAPYLPYELKLWNAIMNVDFELTLSEDNDKVNSIYLEYVIGEKSEYKPILRPLSDLTKEDYSLFMSLYGLTKSEIGENIDYLPHGLVTYLYTQHFDIHNLIEKGLAIDVNSI